MALSRVRRSDIDAVAHDVGFSGVVSIDRHGEALVAAAYQDADRARGIANTIGTRFAIASASKAFTALTVVGLIERDDLMLTTRVRSVLGPDLPLIGEDVTVEHLLAHRSGIGDYFDEDAGHAITDYIMPVPVHELTTTEGYLMVLDGHPPKFPAGERFAYCNSGYVVLALVAERVTGTSFYELVRDLVCAPAGMVDTDYPRSDELPGRAALGYLPIEGRTRTNVFHLPVRGSGDGGAYSTVADLSALWRSFMAGTIVSPDWVTRMLLPHSPAADPPRGYGLGFWLDDARDTVLLEGYDAGVSIRSVHEPRSGLTHTVISNTSTGAWPVSERITELLASATSG